MAPPATAARSTAFVQVGSHGRCIDLLRPDWRGVTLTEIAGQLARLPRFAGATRGPEPYSVAQHCVVVTRLVEQHTANRAIAAAALLHDAHEVALGDIPAPVKRLLGAGMAALESRLHQALLERFGLIGALAGSPLVHMADRCALAMERRDLLAPSAWPWPGEAAAAVPAPWHILPWRAAQAQVHFLEVAKRLELLP